MKKQLIPFLILLITTGALVSFSSLRKATAEKAAEANAKFCTCTSVDPNSITVHLVGYTDVISWSEPTGSDYIDSYKVGGYFACAGGFGPITAYGTTTEVTNALMCVHGTVSIITNCHKDYNYCSSSATVKYW